MCRKQHSTVKLIFAHILALWRSALIYALCAFALQSHPQSASLFSLEIQLHFRALDDNICHISKKNIFHREVILLNCRVTSLALFNSGIKSPNEMSSDSAIYNQVRLASTTWNCVNSDQTSVINKNKPTALSRTTLQSFSLQEKFNYGKSSHSLLFFCETLERERLTGIPHDQDLTTMTAKLHKADMPDWQTESSKSTTLSSIWKRLPIAANRLLKITTVTYLTIK